MALYARQFDIWREKLSLEMNLSFLRNFLPNGNVYVYVIIIIIIINIIQNFNIPNEALEQGVCQIRAEMVGLHVRKKIARAFETKTGWKKNVDLKSNRKVTDCQLMMQIVRSINNP